MQTNMPFMEDSVKVLTLILDHKHFSWGCSISLSVFVLYILYVVWGLQEWLQKEVTNRGKKKKRGNHSLTAIAHRLLFVIWNIFPNLFLVTVIINNENIHVTYTQSPCFLLIYVSDLTLFILWVSCLLKGQVCIKT